MNDEITSSVASVLNEWNPLGDKATSIDGLEGYKYEAMDILSTVKIAKLPVEKAVSQVLSQAFSITLNDSELKHYSAKIEQLLNVQ
jgi:hypothetical protein